MGNSTAAWATTWRVKTTPLSPPPLYHLVSHRSSNVASEHGNPHNHSTRPQHIVNFGSKLRRAELCVTSL